MKIDKKNPAHWLYLICSAAAVMLAMLLRCFRRNPPATAGAPLVLLYGHKLNGNLKSLYLRWRERGDCGFDLCFLTMDPGYAAQLRDSGVPHVLLFSAAGVLALARTNCIVSDHGLHVMSWLPRFSSIRFADVWHGIPYKGWDERDFIVQRDYDEAWVSSRLLQSIYVQRFGFAASRVHVTGYGRTDQLVAQTADTDAIRRRLGLPPNRLVLIAPTWRHDAGNRSIYPFDTGEHEFFAALDTVLARHDAHGLFRTHLNTLASGTGGQPDAGDRLIFVPQASFPDTEEILLVSDVLVCDWSSIAFDFLVLDRPTIFLDVPPPFAKGFTLGPEYRFGQVVGDLAQLVATLDAILEDPAQYRATCATRHASVRRDVYDDCADGHAADRYLQRLAGLSGARGSAA